MLQIIFVFIRDIGTFMLTAYAHAWPYLLLTIPLAVIVNISGLSRFIGKAFSARPLLAIFLATAIGAFSPFCSCGVIPVIASLLIGGVPLAPVMSFWLASPSMDPEIFFLSISQVGFDLAVWRLSATFVMSLGGGFLTYSLVKSGWLKGTVLRSVSIPEPISVNTVVESENRAVETSGRRTACDESCNSTKQDIPVAEACGCSCSLPTDRPETGRNTFIEIRRDIFKKALMESRKAIIMVVKFITLAFFLEALIVLYLPEEWVIALIGNDNSYAIPISALIGIPLYTTNLTALGLVGGLLKQGMNPGGALAFLIGGATTTIPAMAAVYGIVKTKLFIVYLASAIGSSLIAGYLFQIFN